MSNELNVSPLPCRDKKEIKLWSRRQSADAHSIATATTNIPAAHAMACTTTATHNDDETSKERYGMY